MNNFCRLDTTGRDKEDPTRKKSWLIDHADAQIPPIVPGIRSLLTTGGGSLLRNKAETERMWINQDTIGLRGAEQATFSRKGNPHKLQTLDFLRGREVKGSLVRSSRVHRFVPSQYEELVVVSGHRFATYCLLFDRTNSRVITGSDDYLIKIWSTQSGYLLFTLRGHAAEVTYMDISSDNTMLATASNDGIVRVWDLKTSAPVAVLPVGMNTRARKTITTVSFSPSPIPQIRYLIATTIDGFTWVWKYDRDTKKFQTPATMLDCKTFNDSKLGCSTWSSTGSQFAVAGTDLFIRVFSTIQGGPEAIKAGKRRKSYDKYKLGSEAGNANGSSSQITSSNAAAQQNWGDPVMIARLDGHKGVVTSLSYSRQGNRLLSGSVDGFVRIWRYDRQSKMWISIATPAASTDGNTLTNSVPNDSAAITQDPANDGTATATAAGPQVEQVQEDSARIIPTMAIWALDDSAVILTTSLGEIKVFDSSTGGLTHTLTGHNRGSQIYVVDVHPHDKRILMTAGYDGQVILWDIIKGVKLKSWSYDDREFLDGRFSYDGLMFAVTDQEGKCTLFGAGMNPDEYADARCFVEQTFWTDYLPVRYDADHNVVDDATQIAPHLMERLPIADTNGRDYAKQKGPRYGLDLPVALPPGILEREEAIKKDLLEMELGSIAEQTLAVLSTTDRKELYRRRREFILEEDDEDDDPMTTEVPIVPLPNDSSGEEYAGGAASPSSESESDGDDSDLAQEDGDIIPASAFVNDDDDEDYYAGSQGSRKRRAASHGGTPRKQRGTPSRRRRSGGRKRMRIHDSDEDDLEGEDQDLEDESDDYSIPGTPTRRGKQSQDHGDGASGSKSQRSARPKSFANDDYPSDEMLESSGQEDDDEGVFSGSSAGGSLPGLFNSDTSMPTSPKKRKQWRGNGRKKGKAVIRDEKAAELHKWLPSDWIKVNEPRKSPYHPQIGDFVAYFRQGHSLYLKETPLRSKLNLKTVPYIKDPTLPWVTFGKITRITYDVGPPTWCTITLEEQLMSASFGYPVHPEFTASRRRFEVEFHDLGDVPDFIVLYSVFQEGINSQYYVSESIWATFDGTNYQGIVTNQVMEDPNLPDSLWMAYEISWPANEEVTNLSPWEMQRDGPDEDVVISVESIPSDEYNRINEVLQHLMQMDDFQIFKSSVDFEAYPDYCKTVAYPICLDAIYQRLTSGFYRRSRSVQFDMELLEKNALTFNDPHSGIALYARQLSRIFKVGITNPSKPLPNQVHVKNTRRDEDDEFDGSGSENEWVDIESEPEPDFYEEEEEEDDIKNGFLVDTDEEEEEEVEDSKPSRSRSTQKRNARTSRSIRGAAAVSRAAERGGSSTPNGSQRRQTNGKSNGNGRQSNPRKRGSDYDDDGDFDDNDEDDNSDDDGDGDWGRRSRNNHGGNSSSNRRSGRRSNARHANGDVHVEHHQGTEDDEDEDMEESKHDRAYSSSPSSPSRFTRNRRKKPRIIDSDDDFVS
ncbi:Bromodomain and WD repeat-containing protein 3 [Mortierella sp. GBA43]|nr:Bromodomain and WD repeat-containing protein 3 [Mortierella sp. GBA43]